MSPMDVDLEAALAAEPDNPEAKALLHQRSVAVEKVRGLLYRCHRSRRVSPRATYI